MADERADVLPAILDDLQTGKVEQAWEKFVHHYARVVLQVARLTTADTDDAGDAFLFVCEKLRADRCGRLRRFDPSGTASFTTWLRAVARNLCVDWHRSRHGRLRPLAMLEGLPLLSRETFRLVFQERMSIDEAVIALRPQMPGVRREEVRAAHDDLSRRLTPRQRGAIESPRRGGRMVPIDQITDPAGEGPTPEELTAFGELRSMLRREIARLPARDRLVLRLRYEQELTLSMIARITGAPNPQAVDRWIRELLGTLRRGV
jgi:RNA polymerase sigma factor (sigma-70 family)